MRQTRPIIVVMAMLALLAGLLVGGVGSAYAAHDTPAATRAEQQSRAAKSGHARFAKVWARHANHRDWTWVRAHSKMPASPEGAGMRISEVKWFLKHYGKIKFVGSCSEKYDYDENPATKLCWGNKAENLLVKRKQSGGMVALSFWVED